MRYKPKQVSVDAWQLGGGDERPKWLQVAIENGTVEISMDGVNEIAIVTNQEGTFTAQPHSFLLRNDYGQIYTRRADIFANEYEDDATKAANDAAADAADNAADAAEVVADAAANAAANK